MSAKHSMHHGPNMTPMVDIVMCILIFFMLSMSFAMPDLFLTNNTPAVDKGISGEALAGVPPAVQNTIKLQRSGNKTVAYCFDVRVEEIGDPKDATTLTLGKLLSSKKKELSGDVQIVIMPDANVSYQDVITVYEMCMKAQFTNVAFAAAG